MIFAGIGLLALLALALSILLRSRTGAPVPAWRQLTALILAVGLPFGAAGYYVSAQRAAPPPVAGPHSDEDLTAGAQRLAGELAQHPGDADGWVLLARSYARLERYDAARDAMAKALALRPDDTGLHAQLGEILVLGSNGTVTTAAADEFARAPADPRSRYYSALGLAQRGDTEGARRAMQALLDDSEADAPWRQGVVDALAELGAPPAAAAPPTDQQAMIRGMVERLAQRLAEHPDDPEGWERLAHSYDVLGEPDKAAAARARIAKP
jgi:cytochrome c-type biogenesis protein CcmH